MKLIYQIAVIGILIALTNCSTAKKSDWIQLKGRLYLSPTDELGFASIPERANVPRSELVGEQCENVFLNTIGSQHEIKLSAVIDTATFEELGADFYKDKNNVYHYYAMCDGGYLNVFAKDTSTFKVLGCCYASYKSEIFHSRSGRMDADPETFKTSSELGPMAKDKNGYFQFEERVSEEELLESSGEENLEKLKRL
jgi:hypothetical protein